MRMTLKEERRMPSWPMPEERRFCKLWASYKETTLVDLTSTTSWPENLLKSIKLRSFLPLNCKRYALAKLLKFNVKAENLQNQANSKEHGEFDHQRYMQDVEKRIAKAEAQLQLILKMGEERKAELDKLSEMVTKKVSYNQRIIDETEKLKSQEQTPEVCHCLSFLWWF